MAAKTPDTIYTENFGSLRLTIAIFSTTGSIDDGDTWDSGIEGTIKDVNGTAVAYLDGVVGWWGNLTNTTGTQGKEGFDISHSHGTFTFNVGEDDKTGTVYVLSRT